MGRQVCWPDWPSFFFFFPLSPTIFPQFFLLQAPWSRSCTALCSPCDHPLMRLPQSQNDLSCIPQVLHPCRWLLSIAWRDFRECLFLLSTFLPFFSSSIFWGLMIHLHFSCTYDCLVNHIDLEVILVAIQWWYHNRFSVANCLHSFSAGIYFNIRCSFSENSFFFFFLSF